MDERDDELSGAQGGGAEAARWGETVVGVAPLAVIPGLFSLGYFLAPVWDFLNQAEVVLGLSLVVFGAHLTAITVGWIKGFPRWCFPYWGFVVLVSAYLQGFQGTMFGEPFRGSWTAWMPLVLAVLMGVLWSRSVQPLKSLVEGVWKDWTRISFAFYGALPLLFLASYDEVKGRRVLEVVVLLILVGGGVAYMRNSTLRGRALSLVGGYVLALAAMMTHQMVYWNGRLENWMSEATTWMDPLGWYGWAGLAVLAILLAPGLIGVKALKVKRLTF